MKAKLLIANWKMNPRTEREAVKLARASDFKNTVIASPFLFLEAVQKVLKRGALGAQDVFFADPFPGGAYTGEVSATMLKHSGVSYVIVGHSERRRLGETDAMVNIKIKAVLKENLRVILCVGEDKKVRRQGMGAVMRFITSQLARSTKGVIEKKNLIVAYEPVWAIGSGKNDRPEDTAIIARLIKKKLGVRVLYGGSVNSKNILAFLKESAIDGALVGGASLRPMEFQKMAKIAQAVFAKE